MPVNAIVFDVLSDQDNLGGQLGNTQDKGPCNRKCTSTKTSTNVKAIRSNTIEHTSKKFPPVKQGDVNPCSKYDLPLRIKSKSISYKQVLSDCPTLQHWEAQNKFKFGFIPLGSQLMPKDVNPMESKDDPITLHKQITDSNQYNFLQSQITLRSQLKPDMWDLDLFICSFTSRSTARVILRRVVLQVEETSAYCTVNHRALASNYQLSNMKRPARDSNRRPQRLEARTLTTTPPSPLPDMWDHYLQSYWDKQLPLLIRFGFPLDYNKDKQEHQHEAILGPFRDIPFKDMHISPMITTID